MAFPGRNDPCPCGSGKKFKKCCNQLGSATSSGTRRSEQEVRADAAAQFGKLSNGSDVELLEYAQPFLSKVGDDPARRKTVLDLARVCWNLAVLDLAPDAEHAEVLKFADRSDNRNTEIRQRFVILVKAMLDRHREMFLGKHGPRTRTLTDQGKLVDLDGKLVELDGIQEQRIARSGRNDPCPCGSKKTYWWCCSAKDRFAASSPAEDAAQDAVDDEAYRVKRGSAEKYLREKIGGRGPIAAMMEYVKPLLLEMDDDPVSIKFTMDVGLICWNIALLFDPGEDEDNEIAETARQITFEKPDHPPKFAALAKWMIGRHRVKFPELHAEPSARRRELCAILHPE